MGSSDSNSLPIILFAIVYLGFITLMLSSIDPDSNDTETLEISGLSLGNFITNIEDLGAWNILIFSPVLIGIAYVIIALLIPSFV